MAEESNCNKGTTQVKNFLDKLKTYLDEKCDIQWFDAEGNELTSSYDAVTVVITLGDETVSLCLNPIKGANTGTEEEPVLAQVIDGILQLPCCSSVVYLGGDKNEVEAEADATYATFDINGKPVTVCLDDCKDNLLDCDSVATHEEFAAANSGCDEESGMPIGKNSADKLVSQPPLRCVTGRAAIDEAVAWKGPALDAAAALYTGDGSFIPPVAMSQVCLDLQPGNCWPMVYELRMRVNLTVQQEPGDDWDIWLWDNPGGNPGGGVFDGSPWHTFCNTTDAKKIQRVNLVGMGKAILRPGDEPLRLCIGIGFSPKSYTTGSNNSTLNHKGLRLFACGQECHELLDPIEGDSEILIPN